MAEANSYPSCSLKRTITGATASVSTRQQHSFKLKDGPIQKSMVVDASDQFMGFNSLIYKLSGKKKAIELVSNLIPKEPAKFDWNKFWSKHIQQENKFFEKIYKQAERDLAGQKNKKAKNMNIDDPNLIIMAFKEKKRKFAQEEICLNHDKLESKHNMQGTLNALNWKK